MGVDTTINYDERFDKIDATLDRITTTMIKGFAHIDKELKSKAAKEDINGLYNLMDKIAKRKSWTMKSV